MNEIINKDNVEDEQDDYQNGHKGMLLEIEYESKDIDLFNSLMITYAIKLIEK